MVGGSILLVILLWLVYDLEPAFSRRSRIREFESLVKAGDSWAKVQPVLKEHGFDRMFFQDVPGQEYWMVVISRRVPVTVKWLRKYGPARWKRSYIEPAGYVDTGKGDTVRMVRTTPMD